MSEVRPGYKQTDVGVIPEEWGVAAFANLFVRLNGKRFQIQATEYSSNGEFPVVDQGKNLVAGYSDRHDRIFRVPDNGVIIFGDHTRIFKYIDFDFVVGADGTQILMGAPRHQTRFLFGQLSRCEVPTTGYSRHFSVLKQMSFACAPLPEQQAIAGMLEDADALIKAMDELTAKKRDIMQGAMLDFLTGQSRVPGFLGKWKTVAVGDLGVFIKGSGVRKDEANSGTLPCVRYGELYTHHARIIRRFNSHISPTVAQTALRLRQGDILFAGSGETKEEIGKCAALVDDLEAYAGGDIIVLRPREADGRLLGYLLNMPHVQRQKASKGQGDAVVHISARALASVEIQLPPTLDEQRAIAAVLSDMDAEIAAVEEKLAKAHAVKQGMMQVLLTGEIRLI